MFSNLCALSIGLALDAINLQFYISYSETIYTFGTFFFETSPLGGIV